jgi:V8-like Glu-specific endopeptidase
MLLNGAQFQALDELLSTQLSLEELEKLVRYKLNTDLENIAGANPTRGHATFRILNYATRHLLIPDLIQGARALNPSIPELSVIFDDGCAGPILAADRMNLERVIRERSQFQDPANFRERLSRVETWVCRIEHAEGGGTGFLVSPNLILTNHHVMEPVFKGAVPPAGVTLRFDDKKAADGTTYVVPTTVKLAQDWRVCDSPPSAADSQPTGGSVNSNELDFSLVRIANDLGALPIDTIGRKRGWLAIGTQPAVAAGDPILIVQYPGDLPLQLALGTVIGYAMNGLRVRHNARTIGGSSGSPCLDANLLPFAIHHAGDPNYDPQHRPQFNQAIPFDKIVTALRSKNVEEFWCKSPPP